MGTLVWCDRVKHVVTESRTEVAEAITYVRGRLEAFKQDPVNYVPEWEDHPIGFVFLTLNDGTSRQRSMNVELISTIEEYPPGSGV